MYEKEKKRKIRFLSFLFGLMIFSMPILFAGCGGFSLNGSDESQLSLGGVKVLSRPTDYSFKEAYAAFPKPLKPYSTKKDGGNSVFFIRCGSRVRRSRWSSG